MRTDLALLLLLLGALTPGCVTIGRATQSTVPDATKLDLVEGETTLAEVLADLGAADEWMHTPSGMLIIYRHRRFHASSYGLDLGALSYAGPQGFLTSILWDNLHISYDRLQQADARLAVLFDRQRKVVAYAYRDDRGRLTIQ